MATCTTCRTETTSADQTHCNFCGRPLAAQRVEDAIETLERGKSGKRRKAANAIVSPVTGDRGVHGDED